ncbi:MAG: polysulfide reductase NrfD [Methylacidiphilales bacterium]|nr:polysulfide reductase NrfD [Candidatus Methylacidiphilales bacterium]
MNETATAVKDNPMVRKPLILNGRSFSWLTAHISGLVEDKPRLWWWVATLIAGSFAALVPIEITYLISTGVGVWGLNHPVGWAWDITNFVWWVGIGHAGTAISAILFLTRQKWRTSINRSAEAMTIFAIACAGIFPAIHVGRVWMVWFLAPVPNANGIWPNFKSPLLWDVFAVSTYFSVSALFWYYGLIPDFATLRDRMKNRWAKWAYGILALGWRSSNRHWRNYERGYMLLAGIATAMVFSVCGIVSMDFATSIVPGWHTTIFPLYFFVGAVYGGFAMILVLLIPARALFKLEDVITLKHIDNMAKITLTLACLIGYIYVMEFFTGWYSGNPNEWAMLYFNRFSSNAPYCLAYWVMVIFNAVLPQILWFKFFRKNVFWLFLIVIPPSIGMWCERFVIIVTSIHRDFLPSSWRYFTPTIHDILLFAGTLGFFFFLFLLFLKFVPAVTIFEVKAILPEADPHEKSGRAGGGQA